MNIGFAQSGGGGRGKEKEKRAKQKSVEMKYILFATEVP